MIPFPSALVGKCFERETNTRMDVVLLGSPCWGCGGLGDLRAGGDVGAAHAVLGRDAYGSGCRSTYQL